MLSFLKNHPFAVDVFFDSSTVLTFTVPKEQLQDLIPECLQLNTFQDKWAFVAVAMVQTKELRPKGFPKLLPLIKSMNKFDLDVRETSNTRIKHVYVSR